MLEGGDLQHSISAAFNYVPHSMKEVGNLKAGIRITGTERAPEERVIVRVGHKPSEFDNQCETDRNKTAVPWFKFWLVLDFAHESVHPLSSR